MEKRAMMKSMRNGLLCGAVLAAAWGAIAATPAGASDPVEPIDPVVHSGSPEGLRFVPLGVGKSFIVELPRDTKDVLVADPKVANAIVRSARRAYLIGVAVGQTNVFFFDAQGKQIAGFDIAVTRDLNGIRAALKRAIPNGDVKIDGMGADAVVLTGTVSSAAEAQLAFDIATRLLNAGTGQIVPSGSKVVNAITIRGRDQVMLRVTVAEVQRDVLKQLGININGQLAAGNAIFGTAAANFNTSNPFSVNGGAQSNTSLPFQWASKGNSVTATIQAMERAGVVRTLAEPNLTAISGESANFLAGGEFPVPGGVSCEGTVCTRTIQFKKFGVGLNFTPVVLSEGRISLKVLTEVSELSNEGALTDGPVTIPSLRVRRAETTVEIPSGGALAMAGLIQEQTKQAINGLPGLQQVPVLGALFRSRDYVNRQTELVVIVTPVVVKPVAQKQLSRPDDGYADSSDPETIFLGKLNRVYGPAGKGNPRRRYHGAYGFIMD
jgi:pilus assembly protein CpaC